MRMKPQAGAVDGAPSLRDSTQGEDPMQRRRKTFNRWLYLSLLNPITVLPLVAFFVVWQIGAAPDFTVFLSRLFGLSNFINYRTSGFEFEAAAATYWIVALSCVVPGAFFSWWLGGRYSLTSIVRERVVNVDYPGALRFRKYSLLGGYLRWGSYAVFVIAVILCMVLLNAELATCKGCERRSVAGFLLVNWLGFQAMLCLLYVNVTILSVWRTVYFDLMGKRND